MNFVTRAQWGARTPKYRNTGTLSAQSTCHWNGPTVTVGGNTNWDHSKCAALVRGIQNYHMDAKGWSDVAYNFMICQHGYVFEGRGLNVYNGANGTTTGNKTSHAVMCLAGEGNLFPKEEKLAFREAIRYIAFNTKAPDSSQGHRDHKSTACPGDARYGWVHQGMPVDGPIPAPTPQEPPVIREEDNMNFPASIVKSDNAADPKWFVTDGVTKQHLQNRAHAAILISLGVAKAKAGTGDMTKLEEIVPFTWPGSAIASIRMVE